MGQPEVMVRRVFAFLVMSADGCYAGLGQALEWQSRDGELCQFAVEQLAGAGVLLLGRVTYEQMAAFWTSPGRVLDADMAAAVESIPKVVVSRTLTQAGWGNTRILSGGFEEELFSLKAEEGNPIAVLGSSSLTAGLLQMGLVSELRIMVSPFILGGGKPMLAGLDRIGVRLAGVRQFQSGEVLLRYLTPVVPAGHVKYPDGHVEFGGWSGRPPGWGFPPEG